MNSIYCPKLLSLNCSFNQHFVEFKNLFDSFPFSFDFVGCSETFINSQLNLNRFKISGYHLINDNRTFSCGGGVALYVKQDHTFIARDDLKLPDIESIWIESADLEIGVINLLLIRIFWINSKKSCIQSTCLNGDA